MKLKYLLTVSALIITQAVLAAPTLPAKQPVMLEKITTPGFVMAEYAVNKSCVIQANGKLVVNYKLGTLSSKREDVLKLSLTAIKDAIDKAALGVLTAGPSIADTGRVEYAAYQPQADRSLKKIVLWQTGEIAPETNDAPEAKLLRNFIDLNCGDPLLY